MKPAAIGIIMLDTAFPRLAGDVGNPATFPFPVRYHVVEGASPQRVVKEADPGLVQPFIDAARRLARQGVRAIATSCGFLAVFQRHLADAVDVPVYSSSLLQIHLCRAALRSDQQVGIITADRSSLTPRHFYGIGIRKVPRAVVGMESSTEFAPVFLGGKHDMNFEACRREMTTAARDLVRIYPSVGAIVLECTNMPPFACAIQQAVGLPVFDVVTLIKHVHAAVLQTEYE
jgi:Asp/Glu/hydantoin racemase